MKPYEQRFKDAWADSDSRGLTPPPLPEAPNSGRVSSPDFQVALTQALKALKIQDVSDLDAKCNIVSALLADELSRHLKAPVYLTIGDARVEGQEPLFGGAINLESLDKVLQRGHHGVGPLDYNHHAWLTLDSYEILDVTLGASVALRTPGLSSEEIAARASNLVSGNPDKFTQGLTYHPVFVGELFYTMCDREFISMKTRYRRR